MSRISNPFRYQFRSAYPSQKSVYKLHFGKRYLIVMCKALHQSVNQMAKEIDQRMRLGTKGDNDMFLNVVPHIRRARVTIMEVELICQPESELDLLKCHFKALLAAKKDELCLNTAFDVKVPSWIPIETTEAFDKWVITQTKKPSKRKPKNHHRNVTKKSGTGKKVSKAGIAKTHKAQDVKAGPKRTGGRKAGVRTGKR